jgi:hypothetical protein
MQDAESIIQVAEKEKRGILFENPCLIRKNKIFDKRLEISISTMKMALMSR